MEIWDCDSHELVFVDEKDKEFHLEGEDFWKTFSNMAIKSKLPIDKKHKCDNRPVMQSLNCSINDIELFAFKS